MPAPQAAVIEHDALRERLRELQPDALSPRDALQLMYELKRLAQEP
jgi:DNA mismatch repair protein MutS